MTRITPGPGDFDFHGEALDAASLLSAASLSPEPSTSIADAQLHSNLEGMTPSPVPGQAIHSFRNGHGLDQPPNILSGEAYNTQSDFG